MERREYLARSTPVALLGTTGCLSRFRQPRAKLSTISFVNLDDHRHSLLVRIERRRNAELLFEDTFQLERAAEQGTDENPSPVIEEPWMESAGRFRITVRMDDGAASESLRVPNPDRPGTCYWVVVRVHANGRLELPFDSDASGCS